MRDRLQENREMLEHWFVRWYRRQMARWILLQQVRSGKPPARELDNPGRIAEQRSPGRGSVVQRSLRH
jgi:hypothetical protein